MTPEDESRLEAVKEVKKLTMQIRKLEGVFNSYFKNTEAKIRTLEEDLQILKRLYRRIPK